MDRWQQTFIDVTARKPSRWLGKLMYRRPAAHYGFFRAAIEAPVSQHLRMLKDLGPVHAERRGHRLHHSLDSERLAAYRDLVCEQLGEPFVVREGQTDA